MRKTLAYILIIIMLLGMVTGCNKMNTSLEDNKDNVIINIAGPWESCTAVEIIGREFTSVYPNAQINYEYLQNYDESIATRLKQNNNIDLFFTNCIQTDSALLPYVTNFNSCKELDLSNTFAGLIENFTCYSENSQEKKLYTIPLGAEMRGLFVNKTLLNSLNISMPTEATSLLAACSQLKKNGYTPFQANPGSFAQHLLYPWVCNLVANADDYQERYDNIEQRKPGISEYFREPFKFLYTLVEKDYYNYKAVENNLGLFLSTANEDYVHDFLNIRNKGEGYEKIDDIGQVAFMPAALSLLSVMDKIKEDYHSQIEYEFIPAPVSNEGGFVYLSPARGISANSYSENLEWSIRFLDFLFTPKNNKIFAEAFSVIPNTKEALSCISSLYNVPENHISELGQVTFSYGFYQIIKDNLVSVSKANNPYSKDDNGNAKYMRADENGTITDDEGNKFSLYPFEYYMDALKNDFEGD